MSDLVDDACRDFFNSDRIHEIVQILRYLSFDSLEEADEHIRRVLTRLGVVNDEDNAERLLNIIRSEAHGEYPRVLAGARLAADAYCHPSDPTCNICVLVDYCPRPRDMSPKYFLAHAYKKSL